MNQQFKLKKAGYYKDLKQMFLKGLFFILSFIAILFGVLYLTGFNFQKLFTIGVACSVLIPWVVGILINTFQGWRQIKARYTNYKVSFMYDYLLLQQVGNLGTPLPLLGNTYPLDQRRIYYSEITEIRKSQSGYYTIKGEENSHPNTLIISADVVNIKALEVALSEIKPIKSHLEVPNLHEYPVTKEVAQKNHWHQLFSLKNIGLILGCYTIVLLFSYFWFNPINWSLTLFLSIIYFSIMLLLIPAFIKRNNQVFPIILDNTAVIVERAKGNPVAIPFNEITTIRKKNFQFFITGKKISTSFPNFISFPVFVKNSNTLEQKLNAIQSIEYADKKRNSILG